MTNSIPVSLGDKSYEIEMGSNNLQRVGGIVASLDAVSCAVVLTDSNVFRCGYATRVAESIAAAEIDVNILSIEPGEHSKIIEMATSLWNALLTDGIDRKAVLVAVGGGVIGDLGGFVAATYARGIRFIQVPTTLLAQVDSSVGGKVGIDLPAAKNAVGAFLQPKSVLIDTDVLKTLSEEQFLCGLGEVFKYAASLDADLFSFLEQNIEHIKKRDDNTLSHVIAACCQIKARIVEQDELETKGMRAKLNYGHTFGHAFEILSDFQLAHGQAVAIGSIYAAKLAQKLGFLNENDVARHLSLCHALGLPTCYRGELTNENKSLLLSHMRRDKKTEFGQLRFVLPTEIGACQIVENVSETDVLEIL